MPYGSDKKAYEARVEEIINSLKGARRYYVSAFPFYNTQNSLVYNLIHCTSNKEGFKLYKKSAWKVFGAQSSTKHSVENRQLSFNLFGEIAEEEDESCLHVIDISRRLHNFCNFDTFVVKLGNNQTKPSADFIQCEDEFCGRLCFRRL